MFRNTKLIFIVIVLAAFKAGAFTFRVSDAPEWNQMFQRTNGWLGADVVYSVPLATNKSVWLFGDTFAGHISNGKRTNCIMIHSSIAVQRFGETPRFFYPVNTQHKPESFIKSLNSTNYFWLGDGVRTGKGLYFFMQQVEWINNTAWGFKCVATWLASVENPDDPPAHWKISKSKLPFAALNNSGDVVLGCETLQTDGYVYIYGYSNRANDTSVKKLILCRAPENDLANLDSWEFFSQGNWVKDFQKSTPVFSDVGAEGSVSWQPFLKKFVFVYSDGIWGRIVMRTATTPEGPWSYPTTLYQCPDTKISPQVFCYAGKGHPELSATNELLISYAANSQNLPEVMNDTRLYWPRFIRVTFETR